MPLMMEKSAYARTEFLQNVMKDFIQPVLLFFSDGGPDHMLKWGRVKLSLIALFLKLDIDMLVAGRIAPNHSWANIVERIMSILNIAYQNCALSRKEHIPSAIPFLGVEFNGNKMVFYDFLCILLFSTNQYQVEVINVILVENQGF